MVTRKFLLFGCAALLPLCLVASSAEKVLYEKQSPYNYIIVTENDDKMRSLLFEKDGALQSVVKIGDPDHLELPYAKAMFVGLTFVQKPLRVLVVGLGGGSIPGFLHKHYPKMTIDVVDIDPDVLAVAKRFFGFQEDEFLHAYVDDGRKFIEKCKRPYDIIYLDAFSAEDIPYHLVTREFLQAVRRALKPEGIVVGNVWSRFSNPLYDDMIHTYQNVFDHLYVFDVRGSGNRIFVAVPRKVRLQRKALVSRGREISKRDRFPFDLGDIVDYGYRYIRPSKSNLPVLTDKKKPATK